MQTKINELIQKYQEQAFAFARRLQDIKFTGLVVFVVIVLLISWSGVKSIQSNYGLQKQIAALQQQNQLQELANKNLQLENEYYATETYQELSARQNLGLAAPGETEILVPKNVALGYTTPLPKTTKTDTLSDKQPRSQRNFEAWVNFFLHRPTAN